MRHFIWLAALMVGLLVADTASAQAFAMGAQSASRTSTKIGLWDTTSYLASPFRLTSLFGSFNKVLLPGGSNVNQGRISPADPRYMQQGFGLKLLYTPH